MKIDCQLTQKQSLVPCIIRIHKSLMEQANVMENKLQLGVTVAKMLRS